MRRIVRREDERGLRVVELARDREHLLTREPPCIGENGELISAERDGSKDVGGVINECRHMWVVRCALWAGVARYRRALLAFEIGFNGLDGFNDVSRRDGTRSGG